MWGLTAREAVPEVEQQGFIELLDSAFTTGEAFVGKDVKIVLQRSAESPAETRYVDFVCQPIKDGTGNVTSIFVEGVDITDRHRTEEALRASETRLRQLNADLERQVLERAGAWFDLEIESRPAWSAQLKGILRNRKSSMGESAGLDGRGGCQHVDFRPAPPRRPGAHTCRLRIDASWAARAAVRQPLSLQGRQLSMDFVDWHS
jgi:PAS domain-containing protein